MPSQLLGYSTKTNHWKSTPRFGANAGFQVEEIPPFFRAYKHFQLFGKKKFFGFFGPMWPLEILATGNRAGSKARFGFRTRKINAFGISRLYISPYKCINMFKKSPTGPIEWTPKPKFLIALATYFGGPLVRSHSIFDGPCVFNWVILNYWSTTPRQFQ